MYDAHAYSLSPYDCAQRTALSKMYTPTPGMQPSSTLVCLCVPLALHVFPRNKAHRLHAASLAMRSSATAARTRAAH